MHSDRGVHVEQEEHDRVYLAHDERDDDHAEIVPRQTDRHVAELLPTGAAPLPSAHRRDPAVDFADGLADRVYQRRVPQQRHVEPHVVDEDHDASERAKVPETRVVMEHEKHGELDGRGQQDQRGRQVPAVVERRPRDLV